MSFAYVYDRETVRCGDDFAQGEAVLIDKPADRELPMAGRGVHNDPPKWLFARDSFALVHMACVVRHNT